MAQKNVAPRIRFGRTIQRFAILLMLYGGFNELLKIGNVSWTFPVRHGATIMALSLLIGLVGALIELGNVRATPADGS